MKRVDILTGTLGKALGGASGGYISGPKPVIEMLRQRSRPYLFSNSLPPVVVAASIEALRILKASSELPRKLHANTEYFRARMTELGIDIIPGEHPIVPVMVGDAARAARMAEYLCRRGVYVLGFLFPVVPIGKARIRNAGFCSPHDGRARARRRPVSAKPPTMSREILATLTEAFPTAEYRTGKS
jgi:glycine C-acetyltransferase